MNIIKNLKIGAKLMLAFVVMIGLIAAIGLVGYKSLGNIKDQLDHIFLIRMPALDLIIEADRDLQQLLVAERSMIFSDVDSDFFKSLQAAYDENMQQSEERFGQFKSLAETEEEKAIIAQYEKAREEWKVIAKEVIDSRLKDTAEGRRYAEELTQGEASVKYEEMREYLNQLTEISLRIAGENEQEAAYAYKTALMIFFVVIIFGIILAFVLAYFLNKGISGSIMIITKGAKRLSVGDIELTGMSWEKFEKIKKRADELGEIGRAFSNLIEYQQDKVNITGEISNGNLDISVSRSSENDKLGIALSRTVEDLNNAMHQISSAVDQTASGSNQVAQASQSLSQGATEQAGSLEEITSSITEISSQAKQNSDNAVEASGLAKEAMGNAENGNKQMQELVIAMGDINNSADEIKRIVKVIDDIAFQTNLLALNANVEAARAGKYGKGFAVVAEEVRNLATRSAESVKETTEMVENAIKNISTGNNLVEVTAKQLEGIMNNSLKVSDLVEEIAVASKEQTLGLDQISQGLGQIDQVTQSNTASAEESASAAEELASQAQHLKAIVERFKLKETDKKEFDEKNKKTAVEEHNFEKVRSSNITKTSEIIRLDDNDFGNF